MVSGQRQGPALAADAGPLCHPPFRSRDLPWRRTRDPYAILLSEVMLQQTRVAAVIGYYQRFLTAAPTPADLAGLEEDALMKLWQGLGYYSRARNLQKAAKMVTDQYAGVFPSTYKTLLTLPGVGEYTAGAVASIYVYDLVVASRGGGVYRRGGGLYCL